MDELCVYHVLFYRGVKLGSSSQDKTQVQGLWECLKEYLDSNVKVTRGWKKTSIIRNFIIYTLHQVQLEEAYKRGISGQSYQDLLTLEDDGITFLRNFGIY